MERDEKTDRKPEKPIRILGRGWTKRSGEIQYRRYSGVDAGNRPCIFFKVEQPILNGQNELAQAVYEIFRDLKYLDRDPAKGHGSGREPTGLTFERDRVHGKVWKVRDDPTGRTVSDIIDARLSELAEKLHDDPGRSR